MSVPDIMRQKLNSRHQSDHFLIKMWIFAKCFCMISSWKTFLLRIMRKWGNGIQDSTQNRNNPFPRSFRVSSTFHLSPPLILKNIILKLYNHQGLLAGRIFRSSNFPLIHLPANLPPCVVITPPLTSSQIRRLS